MKGVRLIIPYVQGGLARQTREWGEENGAEFVLLPNGRGNPVATTAYWELLKREWRSIPGALVVVEEDNVPVIDVKDFATCEEDWCVCPYMTGTQTWRNALGVAKFSERLKLNVPDLMWRAGRREACERLMPEPVGCWWALDERLATVLRSFGYQAHEHEMALHRGHGVEGARNG